jgi:cyclopropane-fatty-acyl-phospholipid synthase
MHTLSAPRNATSMTIHSSSFSSSSSNYSLLKGFLCVGKLKTIDLLVLYGAYQVIRAVVFKSRIVRRIRDKLTNLVANYADAFLPLIYAGVVPDCLIRYAIRLKLRDHLCLLNHESVEKNQDTKMAIVQQLRTMPVIAICTDEANEQHYEVPTDFYTMCLGPRKKYSSGLWPAPKTTFEESEVLMLELYCERAQLQDGMSIVDLGCGWGSLTLHLAQKYPHAKITGISNSNSQREYIYRTARDRGLNVDNIKIITCNVSDDLGKLDDVKDNDRVISIEMFEHMKNYSFLLRKVKKFLKPGGKLFVHIFTHKDYTYHFEDGWLANNFFTGGTMPSDDLLLYFADDFVCRDHWRVNGSHYSKTSNAWLRTMDANWKTGALAPVLAKAYGNGKEREWYVNWRLFYLSCAELWGYAKGEEWIVSHYLFDSR